MTMLPHVPLATGVSLLRERASEIIWRGRSLFLCAGCEYALPNFRVSLISGVDDDARIAPKPFGMRRVALAFEEDENTRRWAADGGIELLLSSPDIVSRVGDKTLLPEILEYARLRPIPYFLYEPRSRSDAKQVWRKFDGTPVVVQQPANNLTGTGTRLVSDYHELSRTLAEWGAERLKISRYLDGTSLTISGCVGPSHTIVSAISKQLVGLPRLTCFWGAHCGNQLVGGTELAEDGVTLCYDACRKVGDELRERGFLGVFGLDLLITRENKVFVIEINPRLQSVSSLVNIYEIEAGLLPLPGVHLLSFLQEELPVAELVEVPAPPPLGQLVLYARRQGVVSKVPVSGRYRLENGTPVTATGPMSLRHLSDGEALVWVFAQPGDHVQVDTRLCVLQARFCLAAADTSVLTDVALAWVNALESLFEYR